MWRNKGPGTRVWLGKGLLTRVEGLLTRVGGLLNRVEVRGRGVAGDGYQVRLG